MDRKRDSHIGHLMHRGNNHTAQPYMWQAPRESLRWFWAVIMHGTLASNPGAETVRLFADGAQACAQ